MSARSVLNVFSRRFSQRRRPSRRLSDVRSFSRLRRSRSSAFARFSLGTALGAALFVVAPSFESPRLAVFAQTSQTSGTAQTEDALLAEALELHRQADYEGAIRRLDAFIAQYPSSKNRNKAELFDGHAHLALGEFVDPAESALARAHFQYIIDQGKDAEYYKEATFHNAHAYYNLRQYSEARPLFVKFLTEFPNDAYVQYVYYYLGVCEAQSGAYSAALNYFDRNLNEYPTSPLRWTCRLEKAATVGKSGDYQEAEKQLNALAAESEIPADVAGQVVVQRALLQIVQQNFDEAIRILDEFIDRYQSDSNSTQAVQDAYLYEAYAYFAKKEFERALLLVEQMQRTATTISPETALLKIKLLVNLNRVDDAETLLNALEASSYGQETPDAIASYRALIALVRGQWDAAISSLTTLLKVRPNGNAVALNYYNAGAPTTGSLLAPHDFVEACGTLILSYASRYASKKNPADETSQAAVFSATSNYARSLNDPALNLIVDMIDKRRREALTKPIDSASGSISVATPPGSTAPPSGGFANPTDPTTPQQSGASYAPGLPGTSSSNGSTASGTTGAASESSPLTSVEIRAALAKATNFFINQEYDRANETLLEIITASESFWQDSPAEAARVALLRANVLYALDKRSEAQLMCQALLTNAPSSPEAAVAAFYLGYAADQIGRRDEAIKYLSLAANSSASHPFADAALYYLATNEWERRDVERAEQNFYRLYRSYPRGVYWSHAVWALAKIQSDARNDVLAEELVNEALAKKPDAAIVDYLLFLKGEIALRAKDYEKARVAFEMIVEQYPDGVWRSKAINRLNSIPERFRDPKSSEAPATPERPRSTPDPRPNVRRPNPDPRLDADATDDADFEPPRRPVAPRPNVPTNAFDERPTDAETRPTPSRPIDDRRERPGAVPSNRPTDDRRAPGNATPGRSNVSRYPSERPAQTRPDERRVYRTAFSNESLRF